MELPLGGPALRHYTQSRPRPHRQKLNYRPSRTQETIIESENEVLEFMGRVDEGVEEFFTKRVLPTDTLKTQDEESITVHEVAPASSVPCPPQTKTLRRKLGDFFTLKKRRGLKSETSQEGRPKKASIADFIRPLREVGRADKEKDKDRVKEQDKENEKEKAKEHPSTVTGEIAVQETPVSGAPPLRGEAVPPRRALREGKSQSLILLSGSSAAGTTNARNTAKKQFEGQHSFEQKLHLMLQRIGVSKAQPGETQNQEGEMKKAESEGTIIDNKPEAPPTFTKPRTMSASSDTRHQIRASVSAHESAGKPALLPKPVLKPGPPPTTSGRNTPENELAQIQEGETNTPPKQSPSASPCTPAAPTLTATTTPVLLTISNSVPDSTNLTTSPSSTVSASNIDKCTDFVNSTAAATTPTNVTELNNKPSTPEAKATTTELPTTSSPTTITSPATLTELPTTVSLNSTPSESITPSLSVTSNSTPITMPSITTLEAVSPPNNESPIFTISATLSTESTFPESNVIVSADATPDAGDDATSVITTDSLPSTSKSDLLLPTTATTRLVTESSDDSTSVTSASSVTLVPSVTKTTSPPPDSSDTITPEIPIISSSSLVSSASSTSSTTTATSPTSTNYMDSVSTSTITHPAIPSSADISAPSTSSSETNPTDTTTTATSLNRADTTSTTSSATAVAISSPLLTDSDPPYTNNDGTTPTPTISGLPTTVNSSAAPQHFTGPAPSSQTSPEEERSFLEPAEKGTADEELDVVQTSEQMETDERKRVSNVGKESENGKDKSALVDSKELRKEVPEESVKEAVKIEVGMAEPASVKDGELYSNEGVIENNKQEETKSVHEK